MSLIATDYGVPNEHEVRSWGEIKRGYTHFAEGDVGLAKITPCFKNGKSTVFRNLTGGIGSGTTELHVVRPLLVSQDYILIFLKSPCFIEAGTSKMTGTAGQKRVPSDYFASSPFPLPPLAEQHRIVAKVDELMSLCDQLEAATVERERCRDSLVTASLQRLSQPSEDEEAFSEHVCFALSILPRVTSRAAHVKQLRQAILNLAVRGKLVPQDPSDKPVAVMLKATESHKILDSLFSVPSSWAWVNVGTVADSRLGKMLDKAKNRGVARPYLRNINVRWFGFDLSDLLEMRFEEAELPEYDLQKGDVLICEGGEPGRAAVWDERVKGVYFQKALHRVRFKPFVDPVFLCMLYAPVPMTDDWLSISRGLE